MQTTAQAETQTTFQEEEQTAQENGSERIDESLYGFYFKAGNALYRMKLSPGMPQSDIALHMFVSKRTPESSIYTEGLHEFSIPYQKSVSSYSLSDSLSDTADTVYTIQKNPDGSFSLAGDTEAAGTYYPVWGNLILPDAFFRPLNSTDFIGMNKETLSLLRNEFYAVYGRIFKTQALQDYFESKPWYIGTLDETAFPEDIFGGMEKRNILLIQEAERNYSESQMQAQKKAYDDLPPAPYLDLLPQHGETAVVFNYPFDSVIEHEIYYEAQGTISVPVTMTPEEYQLLQSGQEISVIINELSRETATLKQSDNTNYGSYILSYPDYDDYVMVDYQSDSQEYYLWTGSADTIFKKVYEGPVSVLKGACMEYYGYFDLQLSDSLFDFPRSLHYQQMDFKETSEHSMEYYGNIPITDSKGYLKALYFWGD